MSKLFKQNKSFPAAPALALLTAMFPLLGLAQSGPFTFNMVVSAGAASCLSKATATVRITALRENSEKWPIGGELSVLPFQEFSTPSIRPSANAVGQRGVPRAF